MSLPNTKKACKYFDAKMEFTTGPIELNHMMESGEVINIIDVRAAEDFAKGHIPTATNLPKGDWGSATGLSKGKVNIIYCYSEVCHLAAAAAREFAHKEYPVMELQGGFETWQNYNLPIEAN